jgi:hypothetical protein
LNVHFHTLILDGVFSQDQAGGLAFHPAPPPSDEEVGHVLATIRHRVRRLLARRGLEPGDEESGPADPRHAHLAGFDLHANVAVPATDRSRLEQLCR